MRGPRREARSAAALQIEDMMLRFALWRARAAIAALPLIQLRL